jgi:hypothetical protein
MPTYGDGHREIWANSCTEYGIYELKNIRNSVSAEFRASPAVHARLVLTKTFSFNSKTIPFVGETTKFNYPSLFEISSFEVEVHGQLVISLEEIESVPWPKIHFRGPIFIV